jgi:hypothetical protein
LARAVRSLPRVSNQVLLPLAAAISLTTLLPVSLANVAASVAGSQDAPPATPALPSLPLVPQWSQLLHSPETEAAHWGFQLSPPPVRRTTLRSAYVSLVRLPALDRVGRFAHVDFSMSGLSAGAELSRVISEPPREGYTRAQELTPGWSFWYSLSRDRLALGVATGARFLISDQSEPVVDPFTTEARLAFFLP